MTAVNAQYVITQPCTLDSRHDYQLGANINGPIYFTSGASGSTLLNPNHYKIFASENFHIGSAGINITANNIKIDAINVINFGEGVRIEGRKTILINSIFNNCGEAVKVVGGGEHQIIGNKITGGELGIYLHSTTKNTIQDNDINGANYAGVYLAFGADSNKVVGNELNSNYISFAINIGNGNEITDNTGSAGVYGFYIHRDNSTGNFGKKNKLIGGTMSSVGCQEAGNDVENLISTEVEDGNFKPLSFQLFQNYPNPFNPTTTISFSIPEPSKVTLKIYNYLGQEVATLVNNHRPAGDHRVEFNAADLPSGTYYCRLTAGKVIQTRKMLLLK